MIIAGDCREVLRRLDAGSADVVITDPPYGETSLQWDAHVKGWLSAVRRILAPAGSLWVFGSLRFFMETRDEFAGWRLAQDVIWEKHNGSNAFADRFRRVHEIAAQFYPDNVEWSAIYKRPLYSHDATARMIKRKGKPQHWGAIGASSYVSEDGGPRLLRSVLCVRSEHGRALHPTQKPVAAILPLIEYSCPAGGLVVDPFAGSGSVCVAALRAGRRFVGVELNPEFAAIAAERLRDDAPLLAGQ